eukprot:3612604-Prymnesium_polylepis.2
MPHSQELVDMSPLMRSDGGSPLSIVVQHKRRLVEMSDEMHGALDAELLARRHGRKQLHDAMKRSEEMHHRWLEQSGRHVAAWMRAVWVAYGDTNVGAGSGNAALPPPLDKAELRGIRTKFVDEEVRRLDDGKRTVRHAAASGALARPYRPGA